MWNDITKKAVRERETALWKRSLSSSPMLRTYCLLKEKLIVEPYLLVPHGGWNDRTLEGRRILMITRLRSGCNELRINTGRWESLPVEERICRLCAETVEDERHFLLHCTFRDEERTKLWHSINAACSQSAHHTLRYGRPLIIDAFGWSDDERFTLLMGGMLPCIVAAKVERKVRVVIMAALKAWMEKRSEQLQWLEECLEEA